ncbi:unnamed protein product [Rotaria socialis]|uniref:Uncharacterized protein n=1 Tax=Rotaria socialis TaxID=392032 RepID=A0A821APW0_9BILA|nr:unnamed protein product [Rotaria socialis]CAF3595580.1 unnamed protein product [Rotaria socialis]CAF4584157.1 unnamed protein product [Rotaria socialis]CAF4638450.1 unnamed protein product [Rotaria socialis]CAF4673890.1 unnamed protein product [Rotaria socialis]
MSILLVLAGIVSCAQCPTCKTYVPIPPDLLSSLTQGQTAKSTSRVQPTRNTPQNTDALKTPHTLHRTPATMNSSYSNSLSNLENSWRSKFLGMPVLILGIVQIVLIVLIFILEITSLGLSSYSATGAGIWCSIFFFPAAISTVLLVIKWERSRVWATRVFIAQAVMLVFSFVLIGIVGSYVSSYSATAAATTTYSAYYSTTNLTTKYHVMQAQLAFAILLMFSGFTYVTFYLVVTYLALWRPFQTLDLPHLFVA